MLEPGEVFTINSKNTQNSRGFGPQTRRRSSGYIHPGMREGQLPSAPRLLLPLLYEVHGKFLFAEFSREIQPLQVSLLGALGLPGTGKPTAGLLLPASTSLAGLTSAQRGLAPTRAEAGSKKLGDRGGTPGAPLAPAGPPTHGAQTCWERQVMDIVVPRDLCCQRHTCLTDFMVP